MRVGVIRGDVPSPIFLADLEPTSQVNVPVDPAAQTRYISRPNTTAITNYLAGVYASDYEDGSPAITIPIPAGSPGAGGVPSGVESSAALTFPVTISASATLLVKNASAASFTTYTYAGGTYATMALLIAALNVQLSTGKIATAVADSSGTLVVIQSTVPGVGSYINVSSGGTINSTLNLASPQPAASFTMPSATSIITAMNPTVSPPATGSINVSAANILSTLGAAPAAAGVANLIAPQFQETTVALQSYQVGMLSQYLLLSWNPDTRLLPLPANGPAIQVVENDGHTSFASSSSAPLPMITAAVHNTPNAGDITISGQGLGNAEFFNNTSVVVTGVAGTGGVAAPSVKVNQELLNNTLTGGTQGSVSPTSIVIPASLLTYSPGGKPFPPSSNPGTPLGVAGSTVEVKFNSLSNTNYGSAASITWSAGVSTITGLTHQFSSLVGQYITISNSTSAANNGTFQIASYASSTSVTVKNPAGVTDSSGAVVWSEAGPIAFVVT